MALHLFCCKRFTEELESGVTLFCSTEIHRGVGDTRSFYVYCVEGFGEWRCTFLSKEERVLE